MKLIELARIYREVNNRFSTQFHGAEVVAEHDELFIQLTGPVHFSEQEREHLENLGLYSEQPYGNPLTYFNMYL